MVGAGEMRGWGGGGERVNSLTLSALLFFVFHGMFAPSFHGS